MSRIYGNRSFWLLHGVLPLCLFAFMVGIFYWTDWDLLLSDPFYDRVRHLWTYKHSWWASDLIHRDGRWIPLTVAAAALGGFVWSFLSRRARAWRRPALFLCLAIALGTGTVALGKETINRHCPWDYTRYGGDVPYTRLFDPPPAGCKPGHGFPAGHASGALSLMSTYFIYREQSRRRALAGLSAGLLLGVVFGFGQLARGAHFVSHNFWSAAICWYVALALYVFAFGGRLSPLPATAEKGTRFDE
jgi:membrane-associated PAP2 superfamily phosphatase